MKNRTFVRWGLLLAIVAIVSPACSRGPKPGDQSTPTLAYKALYEAVKKKDSEGIKKTLSKGTIEMMTTYASMQKKTLNEVIENGLTETTFAPKLPASRNEKITADLAILEVKNEKTGAWDALPFAKEDGVWKLAIDTYFKGTMSPSGPTNPEHPGELPPGTQAGPPQAKPPGAKPGLPQQGMQPATPGSSVPDNQPAPTPTPGKLGTRSEKGKTIKPPTR